MEVARTKMTGLQTNHGHQIKAGKDCGYKHLNKETHNERKLLLTGSYGACGISEFHSENSIGIFSLSPEVDLENKKQSIRIRNWQKGVVSFPCGVWQV